MGGGTANFVVGSKDCLREEGVMNATDTNVGGWNACERRTWCNGEFKNAFPISLQSILKQFKSIAAYSGNSSQAVTSDDYFALAAEKEVFGSNRNANSTAEASLFQFDWYKTQSNRIKRRLGSANIWFERSPYIESDIVFCGVHESGNPSGYSAHDDTGLAPICCI